MEKMIIVKRSDFNNKDSFIWWCAENDIQGNISSNWEYLCQFGEISLVVMMQDAQENKMIEIEFQGKKYKYHVEALLEV